MCARMAAIGRRMDPGFAGKVALIMGGNAIGICADPSDLRNFERVFDKTQRQLGAPDIAIFNPATPKHGAFPNLTEENFASAFNDLELCFTRFVRLAVPHMRPRHWGGIVTIGAACARQPMRGQLNFAEALANTSRVGRTRPVRHHGEYDRHRRVQHRDGARCRTCDRAVHVGLVEPGAGGKDRHTQRDVRPMHDVSLLKSGGLHHRRDHSLRWRLEQFRAVTPVESR